MAKFKVGDKVTYWVFDEKMNGTIKDIRGNKAEVVQGNEKAGLTFPLKDLEAWNSRACNGKFKINDAVTVWRGKYKGREGRILAIDPNATDKDLAVILGHEGQTVVEVGDLSKHFKDGTNSCRSTNAVVAKALNATRVARNGYVDIYTIAKQEWNRAYRGNEPFGVDAEIKPNGDFKIQEVAHGKVDDSEVDWNPIAEKVKRALLAAGNKSAVVKLNPYGNGIVGNLGIARNACGTARNAFSVTQGDVNRMCNEGLQAGKKLIQHINEWMAAIRDYQRNPNLQDKNAEDEYEGTKGLVYGFKEALRAMGW